MDEFHKTRMGHTFFDRTMPDLVAQLEKLNESLASRRRDDDIDDLLLATYGLVNAAKEVLEVQIVTGSAETVAAFGNLRKRMEIARDTAKSCYNKQPGWP